MGAIGIEALSRGAHYVYFVDQSRKACGIIRENLQALEAREGYKIVEMDLGRALDLCRREGVQFDVAFVDPPYERDDLYTTTLNHFGDGLLLKPGGTLIIEHSKRKELPASTGKLRNIRSLVQGDAALAFYTPETM